MELGNMVFGNSRGRFSLDRGVGFEEELDRLFNSYAPDRDSSWREYGEDFENEVFKVRTYYWGDCTCGFDEHSFEEGHINCYQNELRETKLNNGWIVDGKFGWLEYTGKGLKFGDKPEKSYEIEQKTENRILKKLCKKYNLTYPNGCAVHCTCDYDKRYESWLKKIGYSQGHREECKLVEPNFLYKPTGFEIQWYKYPLRDSYMSQPLKLKEFRKIIDECIKSLTPFGKQ